MNPKAVEGKMVDFALPETELFKRHQDVLHRIRKELLELIDEHRAACPDGQCQEPIGFLAFLAHGLGLRSDQLRRFGTLREVLEEYELRCPNCEHGSQQEADVPGQFTCSMCFGTFPKEEGDDVAADEEMMRVWGNLSPGETATLCDDCYKRIDPAINPMEFRETIERRIETIVMAEYQYWSDCDADDDRTQSIAVGGCGAASNILAAVLGLHLAPWHRAALDAAGVGGHGTI